jgi:hypothetical protein
MTNAVQSRTFYCKVRKSWGHEGVLGARARVAMRGSGVVLRGSVVIDKSFVFMALACAMAPFVGAGLYMMVVLF